MSLMIGKKLLMIFVENTINNRLIGYKKYCHYKGK